MASFERTKRVGESFVFSIISTAFYCSLGMLAQAEQLRSLLSIGKAVARASTDPCSSQMAIERSVPNSRFRVQSSEFTIQSSEFRIHDSEFRVPDSQFTVLGNRVVLRCYSTTRKSLGQASIVTRHVTHHKSLNNPPQIVKQPTTNPPQIKTTNVYDFMSHMMSPTTNR